MKLSKKNSVFYTFGMLLLAFFWTACSCDSGTKKSNFPIEVGERPESITKGWGGNYYVTVMNGKEDGDGVVKVIQGDTVTVFAEGLNEPKGIAFVADYLIASDLDRVVKIDSEGTVSVLAGPDAFPHAPGYLNDISADADGQGVYVTDMGAVSFMRDSNNQLWPLDSVEAKKIPVEGRVYHVSLDGKVTLILGPSPLMTNPNGVGVGKDGQLLVGGFFTGNFLVYRDGELSVLCDGLRGADAVEQDSQGNYYASSWSQAIVWKISEDGSDVNVIAGNFQSAADFYLEEENRRLLLPDMLAGTISVVETGEAASH